MLYENHKNNHMRQVARSLPAFKRKHQYQKKIVKDKVRRFAYKNGSGSTLSSDIFKMLGKETRRELKRARNLPSNLLNSSHSDLLTHHLRSFNMKRSKLRELLSRSKQFKPAYSLVPLAKRVIKPVNEWTLSKVESIIRHKETNKSMSLKSSKKFTKRKKEPKKSNFVHRLSRYFINCGDQLKNLNPTELIKPSGLKPNCIQTEPNSKRESQNHFGTSNKKENERFGASLIQTGCKPTRLKETRSKTNKENNFSKKIKRYDLTKHLIKNKSIDMMRYSKVTVGNLMRTREKLKTISTKKPLGRMKNRKKLPRLGTMIVNSKSNGKFKLKFLTSIKFIY